ncbi:hypothetical protein [Streptomyces qinzhouensis]|uniref:Uncharacterized protein n=1 Tax=Streptomyces qinzhouensis TaxID=2599401 RepID=A0A5B8JC70_9ACTN|nr:hypothetical protein [Streptomyces qinzhouensis]QDY78064.1 hypothetical protein FQU76_17890 [Streptomyces qinzhouensis]
MTDNTVSVSESVLEHCVYCERPVEQSEENLVMVGFSASGARPSLYAHPECPRPRKVRVKR